MAASTDRNDTENRLPEQYGRQQRAREAASLDQIEAAAEEMARGGLYEVYGPGGKKKVANAAGINATFVNRAKNGSPVGTTILRSGKTDKQAFATVAAFVGAKDAPLVWIEDSIVIDFEMMRDKLIWDAVDKGVNLWEENEGGNRYQRKYKVDVEMDGDRPIPRDERIRMHLIRLYLAKKIFAERDAVTNATSRAQKKVLAVEWREDDEQAHEREEGESVREIREQERGGPPPRQQQAPPRQEQERSRARSGGRTATAPNPPPRDPPQQSSKEAPAGPPASAPQPPAPPAPPKPPAPPAAAPPAPMPAGAQEAASALADETKAKLRAAQIHEIRWLVSSWPYVVVADQLRSYEAALGAMAGVNEPIAIQAADTAALDKLIGHLKNVQAVYDLARTKFGGDPDKALAWLDAEAIKLSYKKFFDPTMRRTNLEFISKELSAIPLATNAPQPPAPPEAQK